MQEKLENNIYLAVFNFHGFSSLTTTCLLAFVRNSLHISFSLCKMFWTAAVFNILPHIGQIFPTLFSCTVEICIFKPVSHKNPTLQSGQSYKFTHLCFIAIWSVWICFRTTSYKNCNYFLGDELVEYVNMWICEYVTSQNF